MDARRDKYGWLVQIDALTRGYTLRRFAHTLCFITIHLKGLVYSRREPQYQSIVTETQLVLCNNNSLTYKATMLLGGSHQMIPISKV